MACYEAGPKCTCKKLKCGGVERLSLKCLEHGLAGPNQLRVHGCQRSNALHQARDLLIGSRPNLLGADRKL